jgi:hypothetical protein
MRTRISRIDFKETTGMITAQVRCVTVRSREWGIPAETRIMVYYHIVFTVVILHKRRRINGAGQKPDLIRSRGTIRRVFNHVPIYGQWVDSWHHYRNSIVQTACTGLNCQWRSKWRKALDYNAKWHQSVKVLISAQVDHQLWITANEYVGV